MIKRQCRLARASKWAMGGGGGGGGSIGQRTPSREVQALTNWQNRSINREGQFVSQDPLLGQAQSQALDYNQNRLPEMLSQFPGFQQQYQGQQAQLGGLFNQLGAQSDTLGSWLGGGGGTFGGAGAGSSWGPADVIANQGALSSQMGRDASQQYRNTAAAGGNLHSTGDTGAELLNRDAYRQARYNTALQQGQGLIGAQSTINQLQQGNLAAQSGLTGQETGLLGQEQALQNSGINQELGVGNAGVSQYTGITNPVMGYLSGLYSGNQQAQITEAQIQAQKEQAAKGGTSSAIGGGVAAIGSVAAAAI